MMLIRLPPKIQRFLGRAAFAAGVGCVAGFCFYSLSPALSAKQRWNAIYNWPLYSACFFWLFCRLRENPVVHWQTLIVDAVAIAMAASRMFGDILPSSGHALLFSYSLMTVANPIYRIAAAALLLLTIAAKLSFGDGRTWVYGVLAGLALAMAYRAFDRLKPVAKSEPLR